LSEHKSLAITSPPWRILSDLGAVSVVGNQVRAAREGASDLSRSSKSLNTVCDGSGGGKTLEDLEVKGKTSNMRRSHRSSTDGVGGAVGANPRGQNTLTGSKDIDTSAFQQLVGCSQGSERKRIQHTVVGEGSGLPGRGESSNSDGVGCIGRRLARHGQRVSILITVAGSNNRENARVVGSVDSRGPSLGSLTT